MKDQNKKNMQQALNKILFFKDSTALTGAKDLEPDFFEDEQDSGLHEIYNPITDDVLKALINLSSDIITVLSPSGIILYESDSIEKMLGYSKNELIGQNAFRFVHKDDFRRVYSDFSKGLKTPGRSIISSYRFLKADGTYSYLESAGTRYEGSAGENIVIISRDVTARIESENNVSRLSAAVEQSSNTIVITDINGKIEYVNKKFEDLTGYSKTEAINQNPNV